MRFVWLAALSLCWTLTFASRTWGSPGERVALVGIEKNQPLARQLIVELKALGFEVLLHQVPPDTEPVLEFKRLALEEQALAILHVTSVMPPRLDIYVVDERAAEQGDDSLLKLSIDTTDVDPGPRVVALRTIEILRTSLRPIEWPVEQDTPQPPPPLPPPPVPVATPTSRIVLGAGGAVAASPGGIGVSPGLNVVVKVWPVRSWGVSVLALAALPRGEISGHEGSASVRYLLVGAGPSFRLRPSGGPWQLDLGVGAGTALFRIEGDSAQNFSGHTEVATSVLAYGSLALGFFVTEELSIVGSLAFGSLIPEVEIRFADRVAATWGSVYGAGTLGLNVEF